MTELPPSPDEEMRSVIDLTPAPSVGETSTASDEQVAALARQVAELDNKLHEERFLWVLVLVVVFDVMFLLSADNWSAPLVIGILQLFGLVLFAEKCRVNPIMPLIDKLTGMWRDRTDRRRGP